MDPVSYLGYAGLCFLACAIASGFQDSPGFI